jgi:hypothetical protein
MTLVSLPQRKSETKARSLAAGAVLVIVPVDQERQPGIGQQPLLVELTKAEKSNGLPYTMIPGSTVPFIEVAPPATQQ